MKRKTFFKKIPSEEITPLEIYMRFLDDKNSFSGTSGVVSFGKSTTRIIEEFLLSGMEHHIAFTYGDIYEDLLSLGNKLKIPVYTL